MENNENESRLIALESRVKELEFDMMISRMISGVLLSSSGANAHALDSLNDLLNEYERAPSDPDYQSLSRVIDRWKETVVLSQKD